MSPLTVYWFFTHRKGETGIPTSSNGVHNTTTSSQLQRLTARTTSASSLPTAPLLHRRSPKPVPPASRLAPPTPASAPRPRAQRTPTTCRARCTARSSVSRPSGQTSCPRPLRTRRPRAHRRRRRRSWARRRRLWPRGRSQGRREKASSRVGHRHHALASHLYCCGRGGDG